MAVGVLPIVALVALAALATAGKRKSAGGSANHDEGTFDTGMKWRIIYLTPPGAYYVSILGIWDGSPDWLNISMPGYVIPFDTRADARDAVRKINTGEWAVADTGRVTPQ